jgi:hypothetical protein
VKAPTTSPFAEHVSPAILRSTERNLKYQASKSPANTGNDMHKGKIMMGSFISTLDDGVETTLKGEPKILQSKPNHPPSLTFFPEHRLSPTLCPNH